MLFGPGEFEEQPGFEGGQMIRPEAMPHYNPADYGIELAPDLERIFDWAIWMMGEAYIYRWPEPGKDKLAEDAVGIFCPEFGPIEIAATVKKARAYLNKAAEEAKNAEA